MEREGDSTFGIDLFTDVLVRQDAMSCVITDQDEFGEMLGRVNDTTHTPIASILLVAVVGIGINQLSAGIAANVVSICSVAYYFIYLLTVGGAIYAYRKRLMPAHRAGDFSLGRWFVPVALAAFAYAAGVIVIALAPHEGHIAAVYLLGAEVVGALW
jgi:amino acid transporter